MGYNASAERTEHLNLVATSPAYGDVRRAFLAKLAAPTPDGCRLWTGARGGSAGLAWDGAYTQNTRRMAYALATGGQLDADSTITPRCGNRMCCTPGHLVAVRRGQTRREALA